MKLQINSDICIIDKSDYDKIKHFKWIIHRKKNRTNYAFTYVRDELGNRNRLFMHHLIAGRKDGLFIDHIDGNGLNNQRSNLRFCTNQQNLFNRKPMSKTGYKGVTKRKSGKFAVFISASGNKMYIGQYETAEIAARNYDIVAAKLHGEFAYLNFRE